MSTTSHASGGEREQMIARAFVSLADTLVADYDVIEALTRLADYSVELLAANAAGILLADPAGALRVVAASNEDARLIELMQLQGDQGPCLDCYRDAAPVHVPDLARASHRWPDFVAAATREPVFRAGHALPLRLRGQAIGALNLWHHQPISLTADELALGQALADVATIAILQERAIRRGEILNEQLQTALNSRITIEQAKGMLAQHAQLTLDEAFTLMRRYARSNNLRLADVARQLGQLTLDPAQIVPPPDTPEP